MLDCNSLSYPTWARYTVVAHVVFSLGIRERRTIFHLIRSYRASLTPDGFLPNFGFTIGEFATWYSLHEGRKKKKRKSPESKKPLSHKSQ